MPALVVFLLWTSAIVGAGVVAAVPVDQAQLAAPAATALRMRGTIDKYNAADRMLSVKTANGTLVLVLAPTVRIRLSGRDIDATALKGLSGYSAAVRYSESAGNRIAESIHVFDKHERTE